MAMTIPEQLQQVRARLLDLTKPRSDYPGGRYPSEGDRAAEREGHAKGMEKAMAADSSHIPSLSKSQAQSRLVHTWVEVKTPASIRKGTDKDGVDRGKWKTHSYHATSQDSWRMAAHLKQNGANAAHVRTISSI